MMQSSVTFINIAHTYSEKNLEHNIFNLPVNDTNIEFTEDNF